MWRQVTIAALFASLSFAHTALADGRGQSAQALRGGKPETVAYRVVLKGKQDAGTPNTTCTSGSGLANYCPSGNCTCYSGSGTISGSAGKGTFKFYETYDVGKQVQPADNLYQCAPFYGDLEITGAKDTESIGLYGSDCENLIDSPDFPGFISGGCFLAASSSRYEMAFGECSGPYTETQNGDGSISGYPLNFTITGKAIKNGN